LNQVSPAHHELASEFSNLLEQLRSMQGRLQQFRDESHAHLRGKDEELRNLQSRLAEALGQSAEVAKENVDLKRKVEEQARELDEVRLEIRGLLKTNEAMREARSRDQEQIDQLTAEHRALIEKREQLATMLAAVEQLVRDAPQK